MLTRQTKQKFLPFWISPCPGITLWLVKNVNKIQTLLSSNSLNSYLNSLLPKPIGHRMITWKIDRVRIHLNLLIWNWEKNNRSPDRESIVEADDQEWHGSDKRRTRREGLKHTQRMILKACRECLEFQVTSVKYFPLENGARWGQKTHWTSTSNEQVIYLAALSTGLFRQQDQPYTRSFAQPPADWSAFSLEKLPSKHIILLEFSDLLSWKQSIDSRMAWISPQAPEGRDFRRVNISKDRMKIKNEIDTPPRWGLWWNASHK
jgi:hypothetical protein